MVQDLGIDDFNMLDMKAKKDFMALSGFENCLLAKDELTYKNIGLLPEEIGDAIRSLNKSLLNLTDRLTNLSLHNFYTFEDRFRKTSTKKIRVNSCLKQVFRR